jgi:hypothetical protein
LPAQLFISWIASAVQTASLYGLEWVMTSKASIIAIILANLGISLPLSPTGYPSPSHRGYMGKTSTFGQKKPHLEMGWIMI